MRWPYNQDQDMADRARQLRQDRLSHKKGKPYRNGPAVWATEQRGRTMIKVTRLNGEPLYLNMIQIECVETIPETKVKMMNGEYFLIVDPVEEIIRQMKGFARDVFCQDGQED